MPLKTTHYQLGAHLSGDAYSASIDRRRFITIDNQLAFITNIVGDGRIDGWEVVTVDEDALQFKITAGSGVIDNLVTRTLNDQPFTLNNKNDSYVYMRRRRKSLGGASDYSNLAAVTYSDLIAPSVPTGLTVDDVSFSEVDLTWSDNTEVDFDKYVIYRSTDNINFDELDTTTTSSYTDSDVEENTLYYYKLSAKDKSGNESSRSSLVMIKTLKDVRLPLNPRGVSIVESDGLVEVYWREPSFGDIDRYKVTIQELSDSGQPIGSVNSIKVKSKLFTILDDLTNGTSYEMKVYAVSVNGSESVPVTRKGTPRPSLSPPDVSDLSISYSEGTNDDRNIVMTISWDIAMSAYDAHPVAYAITLFENGTKVTNPVIVDDSFTADISVLDFIESENDSLNPLTNYLVRIQTIDTDGIRSDGILTWTTTPLFNPPAPISSISVDENSNLDIVASWQHSTSQFLSHYLLTITREDNSTTTIIVEDENIELADSYILDSSNHKYSSTFIFEIAPVDVLGNIGDASVIKFETLSENDFDSPESPTNQVLIPRNKSIEISWALSNVLIKSYKIYRAPFTLFFDPNEFTLIDTVPSEVSRYTDYDVASNEELMYVISAVDVFDRESPSPASGDGFTANLLVGAAIFNTDFEAPDDLSVTPAGYDAILTWGEASGEFDGYEILRSEDNKYSFEKIGNAAPSGTSFTDEEALVADGTTYYYLVRKIRNESDVFVTESSSPPSSSILLARLRFGDGVDIVDSAVDLKNLQDPIRDETVSQLRTHKHALDDDGTDKRIDLSENIIVKNWITSDFQNYFTTEDIGVASAFVVNIDGDVNTSYFETEKNDGSIVQNRAAINQINRGISPFLFKVDDSTKQLTFEVPLFSESSDDVPFLSPPQIYVEAIGVSEVDGILPKEVLEDISSTQATSGKLMLRQIEPFSHDGRLNEQVIPVSDKMDSLESINFQFENQDADISKDIVTFYDVTQIDDEQIVAATSSGILLSDDFGTSWTEVFRPPMPATIVFYSSTLDRVFAATNNSIYVSSGLFTSWAKTGGLGSVKVIRDLIEDSCGNLYISTDIGIFKITASIFYSFPTWRQTPIFGAISTESYAMMLDDSRVIASGELGIFETDGSCSSVSLESLTDDDFATLLDSEFSTLESVSSSIISTDSSNWELTDELEDPAKIFSFVSYNGFIFALSNNKILRKSTGKFKVISEIDCDLARKMAIFDRTLYVTTDIGILAIKNDEFTKSISELLQPVPVFPEMSRGDFIVPVTSLNVIGDFLFIGTEQRLFFRKSNSKLKLQYENKNGKIPSIYINTELQIIGYSYTNNGSNSIVSFDEKLNANDNVSAATQYSEYQLQSGGWANQKFDSRVKIRANNNVVADTFKDGLEFKIDSSIFRGFNLPEISERSANVSTAKIWRDASIESIQRLLGILEAQDSNDPSLPRLMVGEDISDAVADVYHSIERFFSQMIPEARVIVQEEVVDGRNIIALRNAKPPSLEFSLNGIIIDVVNGLFTFDKSFDKYDKIETDIIGSTLKGIGDINDDTPIHRRIEDAFDLVSSGLSSSLARTQHSNLIKLGIYAKSKDANIESSNSPPYQSTYIVPVNQNWYDVLNSTIDYSLQIEQANLGLSLPYASDVLHLTSDDRVLVAGVGGILSIDTFSLDIDEVSFPRSDGKPQDVRSIKQYDDTIFAITASRVYKSSDSGLSWIEVDRSGLPRGLYSFASINGRYLIGADDGVYYRSFSQDIWTKAIESKNPVEIMADPDLVFVVVDDQIYSSPDAINFTSTGDPLSVTINELQRYKSLLFAATDKGLRKDDGTFYTSNGAFSLADILNDREDSSSVVINDVAGDSDKIVAGTGDGRLAYLMNNTYTVVETPLDSIHKVVVVNGDMWVFGYDLFIIIPDPKVGNSVVETEYPIRLSSSVPI